MGRKNLLGFIGIIFFILISFLTLIYLKETINSNQAIFSLIFSGMVAFSTIFYALLTKELVSETIKMRKIQSNPKVVIDIFQNERYISLLDLEVKNIGKDVAYDIKIVPQEGNHFASEKVKSFEMSKKNIGHLSPGRYIKTFFLTLDNCQDKDKDFSINIFYKDKSGKIFSENFTFNLSIFMGTRGITPPIFEIEDHLKSISSDIKSFSTGFSKLKVITKTQEEVDKDEREIYKNIRKKQRVKK